MELHTVTGIIAQVIFARILTLTLITSSREISIENSIGIIRVPPEATWMLVAISSSPGVSAGPGELRRSSGSSGAKGLAVHRLAHAERGRSSLIRQN